MQPDIYPLTLKPVLRDYIWGGRRLETLYGRDLPPGNIAESWEISGHPSGPTPVANGYWAGRPLPEVFAELGESLVGTHAAWAMERQKFPLLVKLLDAHQNLSVQVHPDDEYALEHENGELGKTEMWYVLHAEPGTEVILGLNHGVGRREFEQALASGDLDTVLRRVPVRPGQAVPVPAGTVHALLAGTVVTEIQQNSDTTYRVFDWDRVTPDGQPRPLQIEAALEVIDFDAPVPGLAMPQVLSELAGMRQTQLVSNDYFIVEELALTSGANYIGSCDGSTMEIWGCLLGQIRVEWNGDPVTVQEVGYVLLPAALGDFQVVAQRPSTCLRIYLPEP